MQPKRVFTGASGLLLQAGRGVIDLVLPAQCPTCDRIVVGAGQFCQFCFSRANFIVDPCCVRCGVGFASIAAAGLLRCCETCIAEPPIWRQARAAFRYDAFSRGLILPLKYADRTENAWFLAVHMARAGRVMLEGCDLLVPVPLHRRRLFSRRYNQAALLAWHIGRRARRPVLVDGLLRVRATRSLATCTAEQRRRVIKGAIAIRPARAAALIDRRVVLVDDVLTTGSTASECVDALLEAGARSVDLLVAARVANDMVP